MNSSERKRRIIEMLNQKGSLQVSDITDCFSVSKVTARNDLDDLALKGHLVRTHGGAILAEKQEVVRLISNTINEQADQKKAVCIRASKLVKQGMSVIVDSGSTTVHLAQLISKIPLTVITNSLLVAQVLSNSEDVELIVSGGVLRKPSVSLIGSNSRSFFEQLHADILFLGASGVSLEKGITCTNLIEAETKQAMIHSTSIVCLCVDSTKINKVSLAKVCMWDSIDVLITDAIDDSLKEQLESKGVEVMVANE